MKPKPTVITDPVSEFYTNHPYPPPLENLERAVALWQDENVHLSEYHRFWPDKAYRADLNVLVAGCGTWQAAKFAICHPAARVVGIDLSSTSLQHTESLKRKYDLTNLETQQLSIESAGDLGQQFDLIVCTGVLHHLVDPDAGLRALRSVLSSEGAMYLMLYAPYGRTGISMLQEYCRRLGIGTSREEINDLTAVLKQLPQHHPLLAMVRGSRESLDADAMTDALLNPRDRTYSVSQLLDFLEHNDMKFGRWYWQAPYLPQCGAIAATPHADRLAALPQREQYMEMELWRGLMSNHDFVAYRNDANNEAAKIRFDDESYLRYVPIRQPWTMCVQEKLPPGAAGLLVNQMHMVQDLIMLIDEQQKQMYEAIDGQRSVAEIVGGVKEEEGLPGARDFFEDLWWHDQVIFNTSQAQ